MLSAAYSIVGIEKSDGDIHLSSDTFAPKGGLQVRRVRIGEREYRASSSEQPTMESVRNPSRVE